MLTRLTMSVAVLSAATMPAAVALSDEPKAVDMGSRRELLIDRYLIDHLDNAQLVLHRPRDEGSVLKFDAPWEGLFCGYCTVIKDGTRYRLYYRGNAQYRSHER